MTVPSWYAPDLWASVPMWLPLLGVVIAAKTFWQSTAWGG